MALNRFSMRDSVYHCPVCKDDVQGSYLIEVSEIALAAGEGQGKLSLKGLKVDPHDCIPKVTRSE